MSALYPHNISRKIYVSRGRCCADIVRTLCRHCADIYLQNYMSAQCSHYILLRFSAQLKMQDRRLQPEIKIYVYFVILFTVSQSLRKVSIFRLSFIVYFLLLPYFLGPSHPSAGHFLLLRETCTTQGKLFSFS